MDHREDGIEFLAETVRTEDIRDNQQYGGVRVTLHSAIHTARIPVQVHIGFGDAVFPEFEEAVFPTLLNDSPAPQIRAYPRQATVAEKCDAIIRPGLTNSRMNDFYDICLLGRMFDFDGPTLSEAVRRTVTRRNTTIPESTPVALTDEFGQDPQKQAQWRAFIRRTHLTDASDELDAIVREVSTLLTPVLAALRDASEVKGDGSREDPGDRLPRTIRRSEAVIVTRCLRAPATDVKSRESHPCLHVKKHDPALRVGLTPGGIGQDLGDDRLCHEPRGDALPQAAGERGAGAPQCAVHVQSRSAGLIRRDQSHAEGLVNAVDRQQQRLHGRPAGGARPGHHLSLAEPAEKQDLSHADALFGSEALDALRHHIPVLEPQYKHASDPALRCSHLRLLHEQL